MHKKIFNKGRKLATSPALAAYGFKAANAIASFAVTAMLARMSGPAMLGNFSFAVLSASLLGTIAMQGLDVVLLREVAGDLRQGLTGAARGVIRFTVGSVAAVVAVITTLFIIAASFGQLSARLETDQAAMIGASIGVASVAFYRLGLAGLRGTGRPVAGQFWEGANSFLFFGVIGALWMAGAPVVALTAVLLFFACQLVSVLSIWAILRREFRGWAPPDRPDGKRLRAAGLPIMTIQGTQMLQDWLLFAIVAGSASAAAVGALRVAMQIILVLALVVTTGETYISAKVAGDLRTGRPDLVWQRHRRATKAMALMLGPIILVCIVFAEPLLGLAFGPAFTTAAPALAIMAAGQATKLVTGPIGAVLVMSGHEHWLLRLTIVSLVLLVGLAIWLVPILGLAGAAVAQAVSTAFRNVGAYIIASRVIPRVAQPTP
jgi:O-antigen/teichoic acid export membrane protein